MGHNFGGLLGYQETPNRPALAVLPLVKTTSYHELMVDPSVIDMTGICTPSRGEVWSTHRRQSPGD